MTLTLDVQQQTAREWFESLRDRICAAFEALEALERSGQTRPDHLRVGGGGFFYCFAAK